MKLVIDFEDTPETRTVSPHSKYRLNRYYFISKEKNEFWRLNEDAVGMTFTGYWAKEDSNGEVIFKIISEEGFVENDVPEPGPEAQEVRG